MPGWETSSRHGARSRIVRAFREPHLTTDFAAVYLRSPTRSHPTIVLQGSRMSDRSGESATCDRRTSSAASGAAGEGTGEIFHVGLRPRADEGERELAGAGRAVASGLDERLLRSASDRKRRNEAVVEHIAGGSPARKRPTARSNRAPTTRLIATVPTWPPARAEPATRSLAASRRSLPWRGRRRPPDPVRPRTERTGRRRRAEAALTRAPSDRSTHASLE